MFNKEGSNFELRREEEPHRADLQVESQGWRGLVIPETGFGGLYVCWRGLLWWLSRKESACQCRRLEFKPRVNIFVFWPEFAKGLTSHSTKMSPYTIIVWPFEEKNKEVPQVRRLWSPGCLPTDRLSPEGFLPASLKQRSWEKQAPGRYPRPGSWGQGQGGHPQMSLRQKQNRNGTDQHSLFGVKDSHTVQKHPQLFSIPESH